MTGVQVTIKSPVEPAEGPWVWLDAHPERGVTLHTVLHVQVNPGVEEGQPKPQTQAIVKLEKVELRRLYAAVGHLLDQETVTLQSMREALKRAGLD